MRYSTLPGRFDGCTLPARLQRSTFLRPKIEYAVRWEMNSGSAASLFINRANRAVRSCKNVS